MFSGFKSRWTMFFLCDAESADAHCLRMWDRLARRSPFALETGIQAFAVEELHDEVDDVHGCFFVAGLTEVDDVDDVGVRDVVDCFGLGEEARDDVFLDRKVRVQGLDGDPFADQRVLAEVDGTHPALADFGDDAIVTYAFSDQRHADPWGFSLLGG